MSPSLISYAQNFEDILLWRVLGNVENGRYIDIGAQSPQFDSVSRIFFEHGWKGIHVEPAPRYAQELREQRPGDLVLQCAIAAEAGIVQFFEIPDSGLSTLEQEIAERHGESGFAVDTISVPAITLDDLLEQAGQAPIHWLKIDVEGAEGAVLSSWRDSPVRPWVVVVESTSPLSEDPQHEAWEPSLLSKGYRYTYFDGLNRFYVSQDHAELAQRLRYGPNVFDDFSLSSHSRFCATVNLAYHALELRGQDREKELTGQLQVQAALLAESQQKLAAELGNMGQERQQFAVHAVRFSELEQRYMQEQQDYAAAQEALAAERASRVQERTEHLAELASLQQEVTRLAEETARDRFSNAHLERQLGQARKAMDELREDLAATEQRAHEGAHQAHRWWVEAESLRAQLQQALGSHSWRLTAPLRGARRQAGRAMAAVAGSGKRLLRPGLVAAMRVSSRNPVLYGWLRPLLAQFPRLERRLIGVAIHEQLPAQRVALAAPLHHRVEPAAAMPHLDKRARAVLADLYQALGRETQA